MSGPLNERACPTLPNDADGLYIVRFRTKTYVSPDPLDCRRPYFASAQKHVGKSALLVSHLPFSEHLRLATLKSKLRRPRSHRH